MYSIASASRFANVNRSGTGYFMSRLRWAQIRKKGECTDKKETQIFLIYKETQKGSVAKSYMTNGLHKSTYLVKYLRVSSDVRKPFLIHDFATAPIRISLYMRKISFSFLSVWKWGWARNYFSPCWLGRGSGGSICRVVLHGSQGKCTAPALSSTGRNYLRWKWVRGSNLVPIQYKASVVPTLNLARHGG